RYSMRSALAFASAVGPDAKRGPLQGGGVAAFERPGPMRLIADPQVGFTADEPGAVTDQGVARAVEGRPQTRGVGESAEEDGAARDPVLTEDGQVLRVDPVRWRGRNRQCPQCAQVVGADAVRGVAGEAHDVAPPIAGTVLWTASARSRKRSAISAGSGMTR